MNDKHHAAMSSYPPPPPKKKTKVVMDENPHMLGMRGARVGAHNYHATEKSDSEMSLRYVLC